MAEIVRHGRVTPQQALRIAFANGGELYVYGKRSHEVMQWGIDNGLVERADQTLYRLTDKGCAWVVVVKEDSHDR